jgi:hypothetical protein
VAGQFTVSGLSAGLSTGEKVIGPTTIIGANLIGEIRDLTLASGDNVITVPTGATAVWIVPSSTNTQALKVRTNLDAADAGLPISASDPFGPWSFRALGVTTITINAGGSVPVELSYI